MTSARDSTLEEAIRIRETARQLVSPAEVRTALDRMAAAACGVLAKENPLVLAVMNGGAFTAVELCQRMDFPHELDFVHVTRYDGALVGGELRWRAWPNRDLSGRTVLVVDDIVDHGDTLKAICERLRRAGAGRVYVAMLVVKRLDQPRVRLDADFAGLEVEDVYVFGCGMDYKGYWRGLKGIYAVASGHDSDGAGAYDGGDDGGEDSGEAEADDGGNTGGSGNGEG